MSGGTNEEVPFETCRINFLILMLDAGLVDQSLHVAGSVWLYVFEILQNKHSKIVEAHPDPRKKYHTPQG